MSVDTLRRMGWSALTIGLIGCDDGTGAPLSDMDAGVAERPERPAGDMPLRHALARASSELETFVRRVEPEGGWSDEARSALAGIQAGIDSARAGLASMSRAADRESPPYEGAARTAASLEEALQVGKLAVLDDVRTWAEQAKLDLYVIEQDIVRLAEQAGPVVGADIDILRSRAQQVRTRLGAIDGSGFAAERRSVASAIGSLRRDVRLIQLLREAGHIPSDAFGPEEANTRRNR